MDLQLKGKRALVTGSNSGIGAAIAAELAAEGAAVVIHGRDRDRAEKVAAGLNAKGGRAVVVLGDIRTDAGAEKLAQEAQEALGGIDILVNNAASMVREDNPSFADTLPDEYLEAVNSNLVPLARLSLNLSPAMAERRWGRIISISSIGGRMLAGRIHAYCASKAAVDHLAGNLSQTLAPSGITVNTIAPGTIASPMSDEWIATLRTQYPELGWTDDVMENERVYTAHFAPQPVPRLGRPDEIAAAVTFLASPRAGYITGAYLRVDGGVMQSL